MHVVAGGYEGSKVIVLLACVHVFCKHHCVAYQFGRNGIFKRKYLSTQEVENACLTLFLQATQSSRGR